MKNFLYGSIVHFHENNKNKIIETARDRRGGTNTLNVKGIFVLKNYSRDY